MAFKKVIYYLIPLVFLVLFVMWQYGPEGLFDDMKDAVKGIVEMPQEIGAEDVEVEEIQLSEGQLNAIDGLEQTIKSMLGSETNDCFQQYNKFPSLEENNVLLEFEYSGGETTLVVKKGEEHRLIDEVIEIREMVPCVIAGENEEGVISENFYYTFLDEDLDNVKGSVYSSVDNVKIAFDTAGFNENRIDFGVGFRDFEDEGWLFTPDNKHICFFPTVDGSNDEDGLNDDWFKEKERRSISRLIKEGKLSVCKGEVEVKKIITDCRDYDNKKDCNEDLSGLHTDSLNFQCSWDDDLNQCEFIAITFPGKI